MKDDSLVGNFVIRANPRRSRIVIVEFPRCEGSIIANSAADIDHARRPEVRPCEFLFAGPDNFHRTFRSPGQTRSLERRFARVLAAVCRSGIWHQYPDLLFRQMKCLSQLPANAEWPLCSGPHRQLVAVPLRESGSRLQWDMRDI